MNARIGRIYRIPRGDVATGTVSSHADQGIMVDSGMIVGKGTMTGCAIIRAAARGALFARRRAGEDTGCPVTLATGIMNLVVGAADWDA